MCFSLFYLNSSTIYLKNSFPDFCFILFLFIQISNFERRRSKVESLMATLPSKGTPSKPKPRYEDVLGLESQGPVGVDPLSIAVGTQEGPSYVNYKLPFFYNSSIDSNPASDDTHRRRRDSDAPSMIYTAYLQQHQDRQRRFAPMAVMSFFSFVANTYAGKCHFLYYFLPFT